MKTIELHCSLGTTGHQDRVNVDVSPGNNVSISVCEGNDVATVIIRRADALKLKRWLREYLRETRR